MLLDMEFLVDRFFFSFRILNVSSHCLLEDSEKSAVNPIEDLLYIASCFFLAALSILSLSLDFNSFIVCFCFIICLGVSLFELIPLALLLGFLDKYIHVFP